MKLIAENVFVFAIILLNHLGNSKIFERCELAQILKFQHGLPEHEVAHWVCIAQHQSAFNSSSYTGTFDNGAHGLFQISDVFWCSPPNKGWACGVSCDRLRDDDLTDDLACIRQIYEEHQRISGDGYNAWTTYQPFCRGRASSFIEGCFTDSATNYTTPQIYIKPYISEVSNAISEYLPPAHPQRAKIYDKCELAKELRYRHKIPMEQIPTWVCIAHHESNFNTAAIGRLNADGSLDHGLFQISDIYWCSPPGKGWACRLSCDKLEDTDISDDVECIKTIYDEHQRISGDGFTAWAVYQPYCQGRSDHFVQGCFDEGDNNSLDPYLTSESISSPTQSHTIKPRKKTGKVYSACELADELRNRHRIPEEHIATWVCIAKYESEFNTSAIGNGDHGLFQISDIYWCSPPGKGWACGLSCADLEDNDITDDVQCIRKIYEEHQRLSGDGFNAWVVYPNYCNNGRSYKYIEDCKRPTTQRPTTERTLPPFRPAITAPTKRPSYEKHYSHINRVSTTTKKPFAFNAFNTFSTKFPSTNNNRFGGFSFSNNQRTTKPKKPNNFNFGFNSGFTNYYNTAKNPFAFPYDHSFSATDNQNTIVNITSLYGQLQDTRYTATTHQPTTVEKNIKQNPNVFNFETKGTGKTTTKPKSAFKTTTTYEPQQTTTVRKTTPSTTKPTSKTTASLRIIRASTTTTRPTTRSTIAKSTTKTTTPKRTTATPRQTTRSLTTTARPTTKSTKRPTTTTRPAINRQTTKSTTTRQTTRSTKATTTTKRLTTKAAIKTTTPISKRPINIVSTTPKTPYLNTKSSTTWRTTTKPVTTRTTPKTTRKTTVSKSGTTKPVFSAANQHPSTKQPQFVSYFTSSKTTSKPFTTRLSKVQNLQKTTSPTKKSIFDIYDVFTSQTKKPFSTIARTTTQSLRTTTKSSFSNLPTTTTTIPRRGFRFGVVYTSTTPSPFGITSKTTTKSPFATFTTKSPLSSKTGLQAYSNPFGRTTTVSPFSSPTTKASSFSSKPYQLTSFTTRAPTGTSRSPTLGTTKTPNQRLFSFLSAPLPPETSTPSPTKSWFDEIFDRFKHK